jgi:hypothetical protein
MLSLSSIKNIEVTAGKYASWKPGASIPITYWSQINSNTSMSTYAGKYRQECFKIFKSVSIYLSYM